MWDWLYDIPTIWSFLIFVTVITIVALFGLYIFKLFNIEAITCAEHNVIIGIFIAVISVFLGVMLTFVIIEVWDDYDRTQLDATKEAGTIFVFYQTISNLPDTEDIQELVIEYLEYIINVEYPALRYRNIPPEGNQLIIEIQDALYMYEPVGSKQLILYTQSIELFDQAILYRLDRLESGTVGINNLVWWITIIDSILLVVMSWFLLCSNISHYILTAIVAIYIASAIFLAIILSYPFRGYAAIAPDPFQEVLDEILSEDE